MAGQGKGKGKVGKISNKRQRRDRPTEITKPSIRRLARRGGVKRISVFIYNDVKHMLSEFLKKMLRDISIYTEHARRKTISTMDVIYALKRNNRVIYGFGV